MNGYLLDTNHLSAAIKLVSRVRERIEQTVRTGIRVGLCVPVLCELEAAFQPIGRKDSYTRALRHLLRRIRLWPMERELAPFYGVAFRELRERGCVLSQVDIMLAAMAPYMNLVLLTSDRDFDALVDIRTEDWLRS